MKFSVLWHLTRDLNITKSSPFNRTFDRYVGHIDIYLKGFSINIVVFCFTCDFLFLFRSLFIMLDSLSYWDPCTSAVGRAWLNQVLQRHDIARVLEPLLLVLLHPKTHRVSIQRVQAQRHWARVFPEPPEQDPSEPLYARDSGFSDSKQWPVKQLFLVLLAVTASFYIQFVSTLTVCDKHVLKHFFSPLSFIRLRSDPRGEAGTRGAPRPVDG